MSQYHDSTWPWSHTWDGIAKALFPSRLCTWLISYILLCDKDYKEDWNNFIHSRQEELKPHTATCIQNKQTNLPPRKAYERNIRLSNSFNASALTPSFHFKHSSTPSTLQPFWVASFHTCNNPVLIPSHSALIRNNSSSYLSWQGSHRSSTRKVRPNATLHWVKQRLLPLYNTSRCPHLRM